MPELLNTVARLIAPGRFEFTEERVPAPGPGEVLVEVLASGLCSSELPFYTGRSLPDERMFVKYARYPLNLGHEIAGRVAAVGEGGEGVGGGFAPGELVTGFTVKGSGFARYYLERAENLVRIPAGIEPRHALGEPLACAVNILRSAEPELGDDVVVLGDGFMGLLLVRLLSQHPLHSLTLVGLVEEKLGLGRALGAHQTVNAADEDALKRLFSQTLGGRGADIVVELAGNEKAMDTAGWLVKSHRGKLCLPSYYTPQTGFPLGGYLMRKGPRLIPAHPAYSQNIHDDLRRAMLALASGQVSLVPLVTHEFPLSRLGEAFDFAAQKRPDYIKGVIVPDEARS